MSGWRQKAGGEKWCVRRWSDKLMISTLQILTTQVCWPINYARGRKAPQAQPVYQPPLITTNFSHGNRAATRHSLDDSVCLLVFQRCKVRTK